MMLIGVILLSFWVFGQSMWLTWQCFASLLLVVFFLFVVDAGNGLISGPTRVDKCGDIIVNVFSSSILSFEHSSITWDYLDGDLNKTVWTNWTQSDYIRINNSYLFISNQLLTNAKNDLSQNLTQIWLSLSVTISTNTNENFTDNITIYKDFEQIFPTFEFDGSNIHTFNKYNRQSIIDYSSTKWDATGVNMLSKYPFVDINPIVYGSHCTMNESTSTSYQWTQVMPIVTLLCCFVFHIEVCLLLKLIFVLFCLCFVCSCIFFFIGKITNTSLILPEVAEYSNLDITFEIVSTPIVFDMNDTLSSASLKISVNDLNITENNQYYMFELQITQASLTDSYQSIQYIIFDVQYPLPQILAPMIQSKFSNSNDELIITVMDLFYFPYYETDDMIGTLYNIQWTCYEALTQTISQQETLFNLTNGDTCSFVCYIKTFLSFFFFSFFSFLCSFWLVSWSATGPYFSFTLLFFGVFARLTGPERILAKQQCTF